MGSMLAENSPLEPAACSQFLRRAELEIGSNMLHAWPVKSGLQEQLAIEERRRMHEGCMKDA
jgi:hypothetical protein